MTIVPPPLRPLPDVVSFLASRRSRPAKTLRPPAPTRDEVADLLTIAARCPDHGKLEPWRFIVASGGALARLADHARTRGAALALGEDKLTKAANQFSTAPLMVTVVASPKPGTSIPEIEQHLSAGAVCMTLLNAALASGWGANWLSSWMATDRPFLEQGLGLAPQEFVAGFMVLGTEGAVPPDRPRPDTAALTSWIDV